MLNTHFINAGEEIFKGLQENYGLILQTSKYELAYKNSSVSFSVYLEKELDIYVCFHICKINFYLYDLVKQLGFSDMLMFVKQNQISTTTDINRVLTNLQKIMQCVLAKLEKNPALLAQCYEQQKECEAAQFKLEQGHSLLRKLDTAWKNRQYAELVCLYDANGDLINSVAQADSVKKRVNYARKFLQEKKNT